MLSIAEKEAELQWRQLQCIYCSALFCHAIDWIMEHVVSTIGFLLVNDHFTDLDYADDVALLARP